MRPDDAENITANRERPNHRGAGAELRFEQIPGPDFTAYRDQSYFASLPDESAAKALNAVLSPDLARALTGETAAPEGASNFKLTLANLPNSINWDRNSRACSLPIKDEKKEYSARALACSIYSGDFCSVTLRSDAGDGKHREYIGVTPDLSYEEWNRQALAGFPNTTGKKLKLKDFTEYLPGGHRDNDVEIAAQTVPVVTGTAAETIFAGGPNSQADAAPDTAETGPSADPLPPPPAVTAGAPPLTGKKLFLNDIFPICDLIFQEVFGPNPDLSHPHGLIVITGATDSSKSLITRGLIYLLMKSAAAQAFQDNRRRPHLLTYEDPIEKYLIRDPANPNGQPKDTGSLQQLLDAFFWDYCPREKGKDAESLEQVTQDALRQTPTVLYVGETRKQADWQHLIEFAGSGHLAITTSHASTITEAMGGIFRANSAQNPVEYNRIARRVLSIVNIRSYLPRAARPVRVLLPTLWKQTAQSINNLTANGLATMLPARGRETQLGSYGRRYFAERLVAGDALSPGMQTAFRVNPELKQEVEQQVVGFATTLDRGGQ